MCVFLPIVFVEGITKQLFTDLALTMTYSLLASLIVALTLVPAMASGMLKKEKAVKAGLLERVYPAYRRAVGWSLGHKAVVLLLAVVLLAGSAWGAVSRGFVFMPQIDMNNVSLTVTMPEGISREEAVALADEVVRRAGTVENVDAVGAMMSSGSGMDMSSMMGGSGGAYDVTAYVTMPEGASGAKAGKAIEELCADLPCQVTASGSMDSMSTYLAGSGVSLKVYGDDMEDLQSSAKALAATLKTVEGTGEVSDGLEEATTALHISVDRNAAMKKGVTVAQVYMAVASALTNTSTASDLTLDGLEMEVSVQSPEESRMTREKLMDLEITPSSGTNLDSMSNISGMSGSTSSMGGMSALAGGSTSSGGSALTDAAGQEVSSFRLGDVAAIEETVSLGSIQREQQRRCVTVTAEVAEGYNVTKVTAAAQTAVAGVDLPQGITARFSGENEAIMDAMGQLLLMLGLGVLLVYLVMVAQFQSLRSPLIVMFTIPLAFTGGFLALLISGIELSVVSLIGFVMLVGVIVNNGIVLVDYINQLRLSGMERREAIVEAGVTRLRPILMTSLTTILGLVVMAFGGDAGTALMQPVALVCIGGLLYATLMTLLVVPCMYQFYPRPKGYYVQITYNDNAMVRVMNQLRGIYEKKAPYTFLPDNICEQARNAFNKGIECILKTQVRQNGELTVWCAQHDRVTLEPCKARAYELPSLSGQESDNIVLLLMSLPDPSAEIVKSIEGAIKWFQKSEIKGLQKEYFTNSEGKKDYRMIPCEDCPTLWARFYELETNRPFFCDRDGIKKYDISEIGHERRNGYSWYNKDGRKVLKRYEKWKKEQNK